MQIHKCISTVILLAGICLIFQASYIQLKAQLAQLLMAQAYQRYTDALQHRTNKTTPEQASKGSNNNWGHGHTSPQLFKPWPWADMHVLAIIEFARQKQYVVSNASMRNLAFGPAYLGKSELIGETGNTVIFGHRDTHFSALQDLKNGDKITLKTPNKTTIYKVEETLIIHETQTSVIENTSASALTLITCYPFYGIDPNTKQRFVVRAIKI